ncbi:MAG: gephyrin-like molybdotransferase Glp [Chloroflexota bacterium]|nr:gephyrin-like molybdotransferase Glp [Chloroflexota bacterium]
MPEFFKLMTHQDAFTQLKNGIEYNLNMEEIPTLESLDRITANALVSPEDLPAFRKSTVDGYSVRATDTFGASASLPAYLDIAGEIPMGYTTVPSVGIGQAFKAYTGGMVATNSDAVVMEEHTQIAGKTTIEVTHPVASGENIIAVGEDIRKNDHILPKGHLIRSQDIGGLIALGIMNIAVIKKPLIGIISTGDELVNPGIPPAEGQVRDINTYTLSALIQKAGGTAIQTGIIKDDYQQQFEAAKQALNNTDLLIFSAGSSISNRDLTSTVINNLGNPGVIAHGISVKPGKPTIVGIVNNKPVFGLPGNPVSAMVVFNLLVRPSIYLASGCVNPPSLAIIPAILTKDVPSSSGREDHIQVKLEISKDGDLYADPLFAKSNLIHSLVKADGTVTVPFDEGGLYSGTKVDVKCFY